MRFRTALMKGFVLTAELNPPRGVDVKPIIEKAASLAAAFDAFSVTDDSLAKLRMNAMAFAHLVHQRLEMPMLMHLTCRDMSILKLHDYLLGSWALDICNVVCMTGDPPRLGSFPEIKGVYQLNSFQLCNMVSRLNKGLTQNGEKLSSKPDFFVGCVANPYSPNIRIEAKRLRKKHDNGAQYVITQPVYTKRILEQFLDATQDIPIKKMIGILPLRSLQMAHQIAESVPDIYMPVDILERLGKNDTVDEGTRMARELIAQFKGLADGIHLFPLNRFDIIPSLLEEFPERLARLTAAQAAGPSASAEAAASPSVGPTNGGGRTRL